MFLVSGVLKVGSVSNKTVEALMNKLPTLDLATTKDEILSGYLSICSLALEQFPPNDPYHSKLKVLVQPLADQVIARF